MLRILHVGSCYTRKVRWSLVSLKYTKEFSKNITMVSCSFFDRICVMCEISPLIVACHSRPWL